MPPFALSDAQLGLVMAAARPLSAEKRAVLLERVAGHLRLVRHPSDADVKRALEVALTGLLQGAGVALEGHLAQAPASSPQQSWIRRR